MGIVVLIAIYVVLGLTLAWIANMVAKEDVTIGTGVLTLIIAGVVSAIIGYGLSEAGMTGTAGQAAGVAMDLAVLVLCIKAIARMSWKNAAIIGVIFTVLITVIFAGMSSCIKEA